jgi:hypothetical protein
VNDGELTVDLLRDVLMLVQPERHAPAMRELAKRVRGELLALRFVRSGEPQPIKLSCKQAARVLQTTEKQLEDWRGSWRNGRPVGPPFYHPVGSHPFYTLNDCLTWREESRVQVPTNPARHSR